MNDLRLFNSLFALAIITLSFGTSYGMVELGPGQLDFNTKVTIENDSNIYSNSNETGDVLTKILPGFEWNSKDTKLDVKIKAGYTIQRFDKNDDEDSEDPDSSIDIGYNSDKTEIKFKTSYKKTSSSNPEVNTRTTSETVDLELEGKRKVSEKLSFGGTLGRNDQHYLKGGADVLANTAAMKAFYQFSEKLEILIAGNYRVTEAGTGGEDSTDKTVLVGVDGQLLPKLKGNASIGWTQREFDKSTASLDGADASLSLTWDHTDKITHTLSASKNFSTTPGQQTSDKFSLGWKTNFLLPQDYNVYASIDFANTKSSTASNNVIAIAKKDDSFTYKSGLKKTFNEYFDIDAFVSYNDTNSSSVASTYQRVIFSITGNISF